MTDINEYSLWFVTGSQHLYGPEPIHEVGRHSEQIARGLNDDTAIPVRVVYKPVVTTPDAIRRLCLEANADDSCAGLITWMHTFSPAKMWIAGLTQLAKPLLHLHTQFNRDIPWESIDMDFMNLNQSAHGDREFGFIGARMRLSRKIVVGYWESPEVRSTIGRWSRAAVGFCAGRTLKVARFGDNMRQVAVTDGDKVEAQLRLGWEVNGYGVGDLVNRVREVGSDSLQSLMAEYEQLYDWDAQTRTLGPKRDAVLEQACIELGLRSFLTEGGFDAFTTTFEDLHGLPQLPGLAVQRLMADGYGFGAEGDWKHAALVRTMKLMAQGSPTRGTSFMEDYTYHFEPGNEMVLGAHMLEICPSIAASRPRIEVHPLGIGGKADPARLVFDGAAGPAINVSLVDLGQRFRLVINKVEAIAPPRPMPKLPVARVLWKPEPGLPAAAQSWILAGGAHHTCFSLGADAGQMIDYAEMAGIEYVLIDNATDPRRLANELRWSDAAYKLN